MISQLNEESSFLDIDVEELKGLGYTQSEISTAFSWLVERVDVTRDKEVSDPALVDSSSFRILHEGELGLFTHEAWGRVVNLHSIGLLTNHDIEKIIERSIISGQFKIGIDKLSSMISDILSATDNQSDPFIRTALNGNDTIH